MPRSAKLVRRVLSGSLSDQGAVEERIAPASEIDGRLRDPTQYRARLTHRSQSILGRTVHESRDLGSTEDRPWQAEKWGVPGIDLLGPVVRREHECSSGLQEPREFAEQTILVNSVFDHAYCCDHSKMVIRPIRFGQIPHAV